MFGKPPPLSHISPDPSPILKYVAYARYHTRRERHSNKDVAFKECSSGRGSARSSENLLRCTGYYQYSEPIRSINVRAYCLA